MAALKPLQEAAAAAVRPAALHGFTAVAALKLLRQDDLDCIHEGSPRLHRRGRIEATSSPGNGHILTGALHGFTAVAALKLYHLLTYHAAKIVLHGPTPVAALKQFPQQLQQGLGPRSPRLHRRGRIEAQACESRQA